MFVPADFVGQRLLFRFPVLPEEFASLRFEDVDDRHVHHVVRIGGELRCHDLRRTLALDEHLIRDAQLLGDGQREVVIFVPLIDVHHDAVFADFQRFAQGRHPQIVGNDVVCPA